MAKMDAVGGNRYWPVRGEKRASLFVRTTRSETRLVVEALRLHEYPKILAGPEANRESLFASRSSISFPRNDLAGEKVVRFRSASSGFGLRFITTVPPVEAKKISRHRQIAEGPSAKFLSRSEDVVWGLPPAASQRMTMLCYRDLKSACLAMTRDQ